jgi:hypothetical protein
MRLRSCPACGRDLGPTGPPTSVAEIKRRMLPVFMDARYDGRGGVHWHIRLKERDEKKVR